MEYNYIARDRKGKAMNNKTFLSSSHQHPERGQLVTDNYMNQMFSFCIIGIVAFFGVACIIGLASTAPLPEQPPLSLSAQTQS
ncbi:MAG: hypothetical protein HC852_22555 [Acaryochloridaceae cyanobacterium RU_4_10]|jgi:hypothetical protein|nr:hypothetical protein [Acaryochloridaceae cyanobacterium RU_4_10]